MTRKRSFTEWEPSERSWRELRVGETALHFRDEGQGEAAGHRAKESFEVT